MNGAWNVVAHLDAGTDIALAGGIRARIDRTKSEPSLADFRNGDSGSAKIVTLIAGNPLLTQLVFMRTRTSISASDEAVLAMPLVLDPRFNLTQDKRRRDYQAQAAKLKMLCDEESEVSFQLALAYREAFAEGISTDSELLDFFRQCPPSLSSSDVKKAVLAAAEKSTRFENFMKVHRSCMFGHSDNMWTLGRIYAYSDLASDSERNCQALCSGSLDMPSDKEQIDTALSKFASMLPVTKESLCLDCWYERDQYPYTNASANVKQVQLEPHCLNCGGPGLVHKIGIVFPRSMHNLFLETCNWFYEVLVGYVVSRIPGVKDVFVHKTIHPHLNAGLGRGAEIDVAVITSDDRLYFIEVTKKSDANEIIRDAERKLRRFRELDLPFEKVAFVTSGLTERYIDMGTDARIFQLKHVSACRTSWATGLAPITRRRRSGARADAGWN